MSHRVAIYLGTFALLAHVVVQGCSSSGPATGGSGGGTGVGTGGVPGGGTGGNGPATGTGGSSGPGKFETVCGDTVKNKAMCAGTEARCWNTCGPISSGYKNCTCAASAVSTSGFAWDCPTCAYEAGMSFACYHLPANLAACPADPSDPIGNPMMLPSSGAPCDFATCQPCGSGAGFAYRDSSGTPKLGYCVCTATGGLGKLSCASTTEWPPQQ